MNLPYENTADELGEFRQNHNRQNHNGTKSYRMPYDKIIIRQNHNGQNRNVLV